VPDRVTIDVIDHPAGGLLRALSRVRALQRSAPPNLRALLTLGTARLAPRVRPAPTPRRLAVLAAWQGGDDLDADAAGLLGDLPAGAREHWHVEAEVVRAACTHPWRGWMPDDAHARALDLAEPAVILISGELYARHVAAFLHDSAGAVAHALPHPGYLGGLAIASSPLNTTSCSCWRTYREARDYAYKPGGHRDALRRDRARRHHRTEHFLRLRPLRERGTLDGAAPLADVLAGG
jgi:hypothetical protein